MDCEACHRVLDTPDELRSREEKGRLARHLEGCVACAASARRFDRAVGVLRGATGRGPDPAALARLRARVAEPPPRHGHAPATQARPRARAEWVGMRSRSRRHGAGRSRAA